MTTVHTMLRGLWFEYAGHPSPFEERMPSLETLLKTEWSRDFEEKMRNRLVLGAFRYGCIGRAGKKRWHRTADIQRRAALYQETGNTEHLVDIANLALLEYVEGRHPKKHFASHDDGEHTKEQT